MSKNTSGNVILAILILLTALSTLSGCSTGAKQDTYTKGDFSITMDAGFNEKELLSATYFLENAEVMFVGLKETFELLSVVNITAESSLEDYANQVIKGNKYVDTTIQTPESGNYKYFTYEKEADGKQFYYFAAVVKAADSFWLCQFACETTNKDNYADTFAKWAGTITVPEYIPGTSSPTRTLAPTTAKTFSNGEVALTVTDKFTEKDEVMFDYCLTSADVDFYLVKETFESLMDTKLSEKSTVGEYVASILATSEVEADVKTYDTNGYKYFTYESTDESGSYYSHAVLMKGTDGFYTCQFVCSKANQEKYADLMATWAATVTLAPVSDPS